MPSERSASTRVLPRWFEEWGPELVLLLLTSGVGLWAAGRWVNPFADSGYSWSLAYRLSHGERLYRDIYAPYMPLSPYLLAAGARLFGASADYILFANWIPAILAGLLLLRCGRPVLTTLERLALVGVVTSTSLFVPGDGRLVFPYYPGVVHALLFSMGALLLLLRHSLQPERVAFLAGLLAGLAFCCKQEVGVAALLGLGIVRFLRPTPSPAWLARLFGGFLAVLLPAAALIFSSASFASLRLDSHLWPLAPILPEPEKHLMRMVTGINDGNWPFALRAAAFRILWQLGLLGLLSLLLTRERQRAPWIRVLVLLAGLGLWCLIEGFSLLYPLPLLPLSMSVAFLVAVLALLDRNLVHRAFLAAFGTFAGLVGVRTAFSPFVSGHYDGPGHFASGLTWVVLLCVLAPRLLLGQSRGTSYLRTLITVLVLLISSWQAVEGIEGLRFPQRQAVETHEGTVFVDKGKATLLNAIARESAPGERGLLIPQSNAVDVLFHIDNVSPLIDPIPGWLDARVERRMIARFEKSPPSLIVLFNRPVYEYGLAPFGEGYGLLLADWFSRNYRIVKSTAEGTVLRPRINPETESGLQVAPSVVYNSGP